MADAQTAVGSRLADEEKKKEPTPAAARCKERKEVIESVNIHQDDEKKKSFIIDWKERKKNPNYGDR